MLYLKRCSTLLKVSAIRSIHFEAWGKKDSDEVPVKPCHSKRLDIPEDPMETCDMKNGMRLICDYKCSNVTTVGCFLPAGSIYEKPEERGTALFMEHLMFRQTRCRKQHQLEKELERIGGKLAAVATRDMFLFYGTAPCYDIEKLVELLADVVLNGIICDDDIITERFMILRELSEMENDGERVVMDYLKNIAYHDTELGKSIYPETKVIKNLCAEHVACYRERLFKPCYMTMVCTGGTSLCEVQRVVGRHFIGMEQECTSIEGDCTMKTYAAMPSFRFSGTDMRLRDDDESLAHVALAVEGPGHEDCTEHCVLTVAKEIIGSWDMTCGGGFHNAPYIAHAAFQSHLCHMYKSFNIGWTNTSLFGCYFVCDKLLLEDMLFMIQSEWMRLCTTITQKEVIRAVNQCKTRELVRLNDSVDRFFDIATCLFRRGRYEPLSQRVARFEKVTADKVREVCLKYIYDQCPAVAAIGPVENLPDYTRIRASMYWLRY